MDYSGLRIEHYQIIEKLGQGGMATVYKAYDTRLERDVAIKVVRKESIPPEHLDRTLKRFEREAKALAKFFHPNIVPVHDFGARNRSLTSSNNYTAFKSAMNGYIIMCKKTNSKEESFTNTFGALKNTGNIQETVTSEVKYPIERPLKSVQRSWRGESGSVIGKRIQS